MKNTNEILKRYYQGETTIAEERLLKAAWQDGELPEDPMLALRCKSEDLPAGITDHLQSQVRKQQNHRKHYGWITAGSVAASLILIIFLREFAPPIGHPGLQLSDNLKKERFENALKIIGNVLEEQNPPIQKVLYEDNKLIITIE